MPPSTLLNGGEREKEPFGTPMFWQFVAISASLTLFAGMMSGLTVGYLSIDKIDLEVKMNIGTHKEKQAVIYVLFNYIG